MKSGLYMDCSLSKSIAYSLRPRGRMNFPKGDMCGARLARCSNSQFSDASGSRKKRNPDSAVLLLLFRQIYLHHCATSRGLRHKSQAYMCCSPQAVHPSIPDCAVLSYLLLLRYRNPPCACLSPPRHSLVRTSSSSATQLRYHTVHRYVTKLMGGARPIR